MLNLTADERATLVGVDTWLMAMQSTNPKRRTTANEACMLGGREDAALAQVDVEN